MKIQTPPIACLIACAAISLSACGDDTSSDARLTCENGRTICGAYCADIQTDTSHCGGCNLKCEKNQICANGQCLDNTCPDGRQLCDGQCVDTGSDSSHCGGCNNRCKDAQTCENAQCTPPCANGYTFNPETGNCYDLGRDAENCGQMGHACQGNMYCADAQCLCPKGFLDCDSYPDNGCETKADTCPVTCSDGEKLCDGTCADIQTSPFNCGDCGHTCNTSEICDNGACAPAPQTDCSDTETPCYGKCTDVQNDPKNCGACNAPCTIDQTCKNGACIDADCGGDGQKSCQGTCIDTLNDKNHCGDCNTACSINQICKNGACADIPCSENQKACNGTCTDTLTDAQNCGGCENACADWQACKNGACADIPCENENQKACSGTCTDILSDKNHCGACNAPCQSNQTCENGACADIPCLDDGGNPIAGQKACNGSCSDVLSNKNQCGNCNVTCRDSENCIDGVCRPQSYVECTPPLSPCFGNCIDVQNDPKNCGACLNACATGEVCQNGACILDCVSLTLCSNACFDLNTSANHCGNCNNACLAGENCNDGTCQCAPGFYDCDANAANGCESAIPCACAPGSTQSCWRGNPENRNKGICKDGIQTCDASGQFWGPCTGAIYPNTVTCTDAGFLIGGDQNCDGLEDTECISNCDLKAGKNSYIGCEYWPVFLQNYKGNTNSTYYDLTLVINNPSPLETATVYIFNKTAQNASTKDALKPYMQFDIPPKGVVYKTIVGDPNGTRYNKAKNSTTETIFNYMVPGTDSITSGTAITPLAFKLRSSIPVVVYQFNPYGKPDGHSSDASLMMPASVLGKKYMSMAYTSPANVTNADVINIVATSPNATNVKLTLKAPTNAGKNHTDNSDIPAYIAGNTVIYTLKQFDVLSLQQSSMSESTGTLIEADQNIEVFGGAACSNIPLGYGYCDHTEEQIIPIQAWGKTYSAVKTKQRYQEPDIYYILAQLDATNVRIQSNIASDNVTNQTFTLNAGEFKAIETANAFDISANNPILVGQFMVGSGYKANGEGDPSFILNVPREQYRTDYAFAIPSNYHADYVTVIAPKNAKIYYSGAGHLNVPYANTLLQDLPNSVFSGFTEFGNDGFVYGYLDLDGGTHSLTSDTPFGATGYGFYNDTSYGYPIGMDLKIINTN